MSRNGRCDAGEIYEYGSGGGKYAVDTLADLTTEKETLASANDQSASPTDEWHFATADHTPTLTAQSLQWPKSPAITFKDHLSFQSQDDIDNLESSDSLLESSLGASRIMWVTHKKLLWLVQ